jgi:hypothetical protein
MHVTLRGILESPNEWRAKCVLKNTNTMCVRTEEQGQQQQNIVIGLRTCVWCVTSAEHAMLVAGVEFQKNIK